MLFAPPPIEASALQPYPYQAEAAEALDNHLRTKDTNPCVVIPTGGGKSIMMAWDIQRWKREYPPLRCCVLAHRKDLVRQNAAEMQGLWPAGDIGVYSAGLGRRDRDHAIMFAGIDSIYRRWNEFSPFDVLFIDEAHRIPAKGEGKYRELIQGCRVIAPHMKVVGYTATPYRMGCGPICHRDHILQEVCYEAYIADLIGAGYLSKLWSPVCDVQPDLDEVKLVGKEYSLKGLAAAVDIPSVVVAAVRDSVQRTITHKRKSVIYFCIDEHHCRSVAHELRKYGINAPIVTAKTPTLDRDRAAKGFVEGRISHLININVYTEGFNAKRVDHVVLLRPSKSPGLYAQMVGRGLRLFPGKEDCLVSDYAHCIDEHGPIDCINAGQVKIETCPDCGNRFSRVVRVCHHCGWEVPKQVIERDEAEAREKTLHEAEVSRRAILGSLPVELEVDDVTVALHRKQGSPDSIRVQYRCGMETAREWVCLDHPGFAGQKARKWWARRFGAEEAKTVTVWTAMEDMFLGNRIGNLTLRIRTVKRGKYTEIIGHLLKNEQVFS